MSRDNVLVIGGDGLLGSHLVRKLINHGYAVRVLVQPHSPSPTLSGLPIQRIEKDLMSPHGTLCTAMRGCRYVFHLAAITDLWAPPALIWKVNLEGTRRVIDACLAARVERLVFTGSASTFAFGTEDAPGDERGAFPQAYRGIDYAESKHLALQAVQAAGDERGLNAVTVAPTFLLGAYDWRPSSGKLVRYLVERKLQFAPPGGRNFAYGPDVAEAMVAAAHRGRTGHAYIAGGHNCSYREFFSRVARLAGARSTPILTLPPWAIRRVGALGSLSARVLSRPARINRATARLSLCTTYYSSAKAERELGLAPAPLDRAIADSLASLRQYGHIR